METPIPAATPATVAAIITAAGVAATTAAGVAAITAAVERITAGDSVQEVSSRGTRPEPIIPSINLLDGPVNPYLRRSCWARTRKPTGCRRRTGNALRHTRIINDLQ